MGKLEIGSYVVTVTPKESVIMYSIKEKNRKTQFGNKAYVENFLGSGWMSDPSADPDSITGKFTASGRTIKVKEIKVNLYNH